MFRAFKIFTGFLAALFALVFAAWVCGFIIYTGTISSMNEPKTVTKTDAIIVLTGGTNRVARGIDLLSEGNSRHLLISGVNQGVKLEELLKLWGYKRPLPDCCIILGYEAESTLGNALEARKWISSNNIRSVRLITATYHTPRSLLEFRHALPDTIIVSHPVKPADFNPDTKKFWKLCLLEYHKWIVSVIRITFYPFETNPMPAALK